MKKQIPQTTEKLLSAAEKEFLEYGYADANLRRISAASGVSTHTIYTRFKDKAGLFDALVKVPAQELKELFMDAMSGLETCTGYSDAVDVSDDGTDKVLSYIYDHIQAFRLIFCCSAGTPYAHYLEDMAAIEEKAYLDWIIRILGEISPTAEFFIHVMCASGYRELYELVSHNLPIDEAKKFMELEKQYHFAGWKAIMGLL